MSNFDAIIADIENADLKTREGRTALEARVRTTYPIRDIVFAADFLRGGIFISTPEPSASSFLRKVAHGEKVEYGWTRTSAGIVTGTHEEDSELSRLWAGLVRTCYFYIGAASVLNMQGSRLIAGYAFADDGDGPTVYDLTLDDLISRTPEGLRNRIDKDLAPIRKRNDGQRAKVAELTRKLKALEHARNTSPKKI